MQERLRRGSLPSQVLREFHAADGEGAAGCDGWGAEQLARFVHRWVAERREREEVEAAFEAAEYVEVTPAYADCTGRYVEVSFPRAA